MACSSRFESPEAARQTHFVQGVLDFSEAILIHGVEHEILTEALMKEYIPDIVLRL